MGHHSYEEAKKLVWKGCGILAAVTLVEVAVSLFQKGHIIESVADVKAIVIICALVIGVLSIYKAYYIIYNFMHMAQEVPGLRMSVLLPTALLIWGMIAFFQEGNSWGERRELIKEKDRVESEAAIKPQGMRLEPYKLENLQ